MPRPDQDSRDGTGRYHRTLEGAERDRRAAELFDQGWTYQRIADELGIDKSTAIRAVQRAVRAVVKDAGESVVKTMIGRLEYAYLKAIEIAETEHVLVSHGKVIVGQDGVPLRDHAPVLAALREARQTIESFCRMTGVGQPLKIDATVHQVSQEDIELAELIREAQAKNAANEAAIKGESTG
jgi:hypothetical protein